MSTDVAMPAEMASSGVRSRWRPGRRCRRAAPSPGPRGPPTTNAMPAMARPPTPMRRLELAGQLALEPARRPAHPEDHPGDEDDGDDGGDRLEQLPRLRVGQQRRLGVGEQRAEQHGERRSAPATPAHSGSSSPPPTGLHQVGDEDADDQRDLETLAEPDEVAGEEGLTHGATRSTTTRPRRTTKGSLTLALAAGPRNPGLL